MGDDFLRKQGLREVVPRLWGERVMKTAFTCFFRQRLVWWSIVFVVGWQGAVWAADWETVPDCRLIEDRYFDGDSFHVRVQGQDRVFRLYAVDAPETNNDFPERVKEQKKYFSTTKKAILAGGQEALELTRNLLKEPFTVETKWVDAKGNSQQPRFFAKVILSDGTDLGMRLLEAGLARSYGMREDLPMSYLSQLDKAQAAAQKEGRGLWSTKAGRKDKKERTKS